jgi:hypothetical protein
VSKQLFLLSVFIWRSQEKALVCRPDAVAYSKSGLFPLGAHMPSLSLCLSKRFKDKSTISSTLAKKIPTHSTSHPVFWYIESQEASRSHKCLAIILQLHNTLLVLRNYLLNWANWSNGHMHMHRRIVELTLRNTIVAIEEVSDVTNRMLIIVGNLHTSLQASFKFRRS